MDSFARWALQEEVQGPDKSDFALEIEIDRQSRWSDMDDQLRTKQNGKSLGAEEHAVTIECEEE